MAINEVGGEDNSTEATSPLIKEEPKEETASSNNEESASSIKEESPSSSSVNEETTSCSSQNTSAAASTPLSSTTLGSTPPQIPLKRKRWEYHDDGNEGVIKKFHPRYSVASKARHTKDGHVPDDIDEKIMTKYKLYDDKWAPIMQPTGDELNDPAKKLRAGCWHSKKSENPKCRTCWVEGVGETPSGLEEEEYMPCGCLTVDGLVEQYMANEGWLAEAVGVDIRKKPADAALGQRDAVMSFLHKQFGKYREEFLTSRNARALGMLAASDIGHLISFDKTSVEGRKAQATYEKYKTDIEDNEGWQYAKDPA